MRATPDRIGRFSARQRFHLVNAYIGFLLSSGRFARRSKWLWINGFSIGKPSKNQNGDESKFLLTILQLKVDYGPH
jgi:hypothetical protein